MKMTVIDDKILIEDAQMEWVYFAGPNDYGKYSLKLILDEEEAEELERITMGLLRSGKTLVNFQSPVTVSRPIGHNGKTNDVVFKLMDDTVAPISDTPVVPIPSIRGNIVVRPYHFNIMGNEGVKLSLYGVRLLEPIATTPTASGNSVVDLL